MSDAPPGTSSPSVPIKRRVPVWIWWATSAILGTLAIIINAIYGQQIKQAWLQHKANEVIKSDVQHSEIQSLCVTNEHIYALLKFYIETKYSSSWTPSAFGESNEKLYLLKWKTDEWTNNQPPRVIGVPCSGYDRIVVCDGHPVLIYEKYNVISGDGSLCKLNVRATFLDNYQPPISHTYTCEPLHSVGFFENPLGYWRLSWHQGDFIDSPTDSPVLINDITGENVLKANIRDPILEFIHECNADPMATRISTDGHYLMANRGSRLLFNVWTGELKKISSSDGIIVGFGTNHGVFNYIVSNNHSRTIFDETGKKLNSFVIPDDPDDINRAVRTVREVCDWELNRTYYFREPTEPIQKEMVVDIVDWKTGRLQTVTSHLPIKAE